MTPQQKSTIVIAGAGYAGLAAARTLAHDPNLRVILLNKHAYHLLQFQLHEAAVNKIEIDTLALPLSDLLPREVELIKARINEFDFPAKTVHTDRGAVAYDRLIIALGSQPATFNIPGLSEHALMLKSLSNARSIRGHLEMTFSELATTTRSAPYPIVIGGGGITGVELAAELAEGLKSIARAYGLRPTELKVILVEAAPVVLPGLDDPTTREAGRALKRLGVEVHTHMAIERVTADRVWLKPLGSDLPAEEIATQTVIWTGGVQANALVQNSGLTLGERGAALVDEYLRSIDYPEVSIVGDNAVIRDPRTGQVVIPCGQLAAQQGKYAGRQILAELHDVLARPYLPHMDGLLISLGSYSGVGMVGPIWVRRLVARIMKIGAETRYLFNIGGVPLALTRGLQLRHEFVAVRRWLRSAMRRSQRPTIERQGDAIS